MDANAGQDVKGAVALLRSERARLRDELEELGDKVLVTSWDGHDAADLGTVPQNVSSPRPCSSGAAGASPR